MQMNILSVIIAVALSGYLLFRAVIKPRTPRFFMLDRATERGLLYDVAVLSKHCATTERGGGIDGRKLEKRLKGIFKAVHARADANRPLSAPLALLAENEYAVRAACARAKKTARKSYLLGHADGLPRIFTFCKLIVENTRGSVTHKLLCDAVRVYNETAPLTFRESEFLPDMLAFCLCGLIYEAAARALARTNTHERGVRDGAANEVNLDLLTDDAYVSGLFESMSGDSDSLDKLAVYNDVDAGRSSSACRRMTAELATVIAECVSALGTVSSLDTADVIGFSAANAELSKNAEYAAFGVEEKAAILEELYRRASRRRVSDFAAARDISATAAADGGRISAILFPRKRAVKLRICRLAAVVIVAVALTATAAVFVPRGYMFCVPFLAVFFACAERIIENAAAVYSARRAHACPLVEAPTEIIDRAGRIVKSFVPVSQVVLYFVCARFYSLSLFIIATLPLITEISVAVAVSVARASYKPLMRILTAFKRYSVLPSLAVTAPLAVFDIAVPRKYKQIMVRALRALAAIALITLGAAFDGYAAIAVGALFLSAAFYDEHITLRARVRKRLRSARKASDKNFRLSDVLSSDDETGYFRGDGAYSINLVDNDEIFAVFDSRGAVKLTKGERAIAELFVSCSCGGVTASLADCDGVSERHRTTYRAVSGECEFTAELIVPTDTNGCVCRVSVVNRTEHIQPIELSARCAVGTPPVSIEAFSNGLGVYDGHNAVGMFLFGERAYFKRDGADISVCMPTALEGFEKKSFVLAALTARTLGAVARTAELIECETYFDRAERAARVFSALGERYDTALAERLARDEFDTDPEIGNAHLPTVIGAARDSAFALKKFGLSFNAVVCGDGYAYCGSTRVDLARAREIAVNGASLEAAEESQIPTAIGADFAPNYSDPAPSPVEFSTDYELKTPFGGITVDGKLVVESPFERGGLSDTVCDGEMLCRDGSFHTAASLEPIAAFGIAVGENGKVAVPDICRGRDATKIFENGVIRFIGSAGDIDTDIKQYAARGKGGLILDVTLGDLAGRDRTLDLMFYATVGIPRPVKFGEVKNGIYVTGRANGRGFVMLASESIDEITPYKDGYFRHGGIDRTRGFGIGNTEVAPAMTVELNVAARSSARAVFCIVAVDGIAKIDEISLKAADAFYARESEFCTSSLPISINTTDKKLDCLYNTSFYNAFVCGFLRSELYNGFCGVECLAAKFACAEDVKRKLIAYCRAIARGELSTFEKLMTVVAVNDYINYSGSDSVLSTSVVDGDNALSVADCCVMALDCAICKLSKNPDLYEFLLCIFAFGAACEHFGRKAYFRCLSELKLCTVIYPDGVDAAALLAQAVAAFEYGDDRAGSELLSKVEDMLFDGAESANITLFGERSELSASAVYSAFFAVVTKYALGISYRNGKIVPCPHTSAVSPHTEYRISSRNKRGKSMRVIVEDGEKRGEWRMKIGKITYPVTRIDPDAEISEPILLCRGDGEVEN